MVPIASSSDQFGLDQQLQVEHQRGLLNFDLPVWWYQQQVQEIHSSSLPKEVRREYVRVLSSLFLVREHWEKSNLFKGITKDGRLRQMHGPIPPPTTALSNFSYGEESWRR